MIGKKTYVPLINVPPGQQIGETLTIIILATLWFVSPEFTENKKVWIESKLK